MKYTFLIKHFLLTSFFLAIGYLSYAREIRNMDMNWKFKLGDHPGAEIAGFNDRNWRTLDVPHDWSIEFDFKEDAYSGFSNGYVPTGIGWYRKTFNLSKNDLGKNLQIVFDGVYMNSDVWINGKHLGHYPYGYNSFYYTLTPHVKTGSNTLVVRVDNSLQPSSRWYTGSGIYRHVKLVLTNPVHVPQYGIYLSTPEVEKDFALVSVKTKIENKNQSKREGSLLSIIVDKNGQEKARLETSFSLEKNGQTEVVQILRVANPNLWSPDFPELYQLKTFIFEKGKETDDQITNFGIRKIEYHADKGFLLNGKQTKMKGVNLHHDGGAVGAAVPEAVWIRRLRILKEMGCNAIRTAHNPVAPEFLDMCDSLGFLVMNEAFDEWQLSKREYGYNKYFDEWHKFDLTRMIHRDRNHPSVVLWSVGNEVHEQSTDEGYKILKTLVDICHTEDPTRPVTVGCDRIDMPKTPTGIEFLKSLDIVGYNYVDRYIHRRELSFLYDKLRFPEWKIIGTENSAIYSVRGEYSLGKDPKKVSPDYNTTMIDIELLWRNILTNDFVIGDFMWTGIDYLGEMKWPSITPPCGVTDRCGFPKDAYYFYKSIWTNEPVVHLFPHWNWSGREGQIIPVLCYTNCDVVELFVNGKSYGEKRLKVLRDGKTICGNWSTYNPKEHITTSDYHLSWDVAYEPGVIKAIGKKNGLVVFTEELKTTDEPKALRISVDKMQLNTKNRDVAHVKVEIIDKNGNVVPYANNQIRFLVEGEGKLIGTDNGNPTEHSSMKNSNKNAFHGLCMALIQTNGKTGTIKITAQAENLEKSTIIINSR